MLKRSLLFAATTLAVTLPFAALAAPPPSEPPIGGNGGRGMAILRPCASAQLAAAVTSQTGAMMHRELRIMLTNVSQRACAVDGFPAVRLLDERKAPQIVAESFSRTPRLFIIAPAQAAAFMLRIATGDGVTSYRSVHTLAIIPPGDTAPILLDVELPVAPTIDVTALFPAALVQFAAPRSGGEQR
ncbi:MAG TPA: DUF4232 domain-containing protein [Candidatus Elarobacter sp.]|nr:DUF4232 domain-containing protein [Candidatus Elarobacter sp.]